MVGVGCGLWAVELNCQNVHQNQHQERCIIQASIASASQQKLGKYFTSDWRKYVTETLLNNASEHAKYFLEKQSHLNDVEHLAIPGSFLT